MLTRKINLQYFLMRTNEQQKKRNVNYFSCENSVMAKKSIYHASFQSVLKEVRQINITNIFFGEYFSIDKRSPSPEPFGFGFGGYGGRFGLGGYGGYYGGRHGFGRSFGRGRFYGRGFRRALGTGLILGGAAFGGALIGAGFAQNGFGK